MKLTETEKLKGASPRRGRFQFSHVLASPTVPSYVIDVRNYVRTVMVTYIIYARPPLMSSRMAACMLFFPCPGPPLRLRLPAHYYSAARPCGYGCLLIIIQRLMTTCRLMLRRSVRFSSNNYSAQQSIQRGGGVLVLSLPSSS